MSFTYRDQPRNWTVMRELYITDSASTPVWLVPRADQLNDRYRYQLTLFNGDAAPIELSEAEASGENLFLRAPIASDERHATQRLLSHPVRRRRRVPGPRDAGTRYSSDCSGAGQRLVRRSGVPNHRLPSRGHRHRRIATRAVMSMDVELPVRAATLDRIRDEITGAGGQEPRLVPVPLHGGEVSLEVLGQAAGQPDIHVYTGHAPNLMGSYRAAFAVAAEGTEARVLMAAVISGNVPAVLRYHVQYLGLAPSFKASMRVHCGGVSEPARPADDQLHLRRRRDGQGSGVAATGALRQIEVLELDPDGASAATTALFDELKTQIVQKLFSPPRQHGEVPIEDRISRGVRTLLVSLMPGVSHILRELRQSQLSDTTIT